MTRIRTGIISLALESLWMSTAGMNLFDLTPEQLKRAASIKEQIDGLNKQLRGILGAPAISRAAPPENRTISAAVKKKIATTQKLAIEAELHGVLFARECIDKNVR